jgi:hypothetical protein
VKDLNQFSDTPNPPETPPRDLIARVRLAARMRRSADSVLRLPRCPIFYRWVVETVGNEAADGALEPAHTTALEVGLSVLQQLPGVAEIRAARQAALPQASPDTMYLLSDFPHVEVLAAGTDDSREYRLHVPKDFSKRLTNIARHLGIRHTRLGIFALAAGLLQAPANLIRAPYRRAMEQSLLNLAKAIKRRAAEIQARAAVMPPEDPDDEADDAQRTLADLIKQPEVPDEGQDESGE